MIEPWQIGEENEQDSKQLQWNYHQEIFSDILIFQHDSD